MQETILCYNLNEDRKAEVEHLAKPLNILVKHIDKEDFSQPLAVLCGLAEKQNKKYPEEYFDDEMMVLCFFEQDKFNQFLSSFRQNSIKPIALKAVLTPNNSVWSGGRLHKDLLEEHNYFMQQRKAKS